MIQIRRISRLSKLSHLPNSPLLTADSWTMNVENMDAETNSRISGASHFTRHILNGDHTAAWRDVEHQIERDDHFLKNFRAASCSKFLRTLPDGSYDSQFYWPRAWRFANAMKRVGLQLTSQDYISLINIAFKARDYTAVEDLWHEIETMHPELLGRIDLWNAYIQASCQAYALFWPIKNKPLRLPAEEAPQLVGNIVDIIKKMDLAGVCPNAKSYELIILAFARQGDMETVKNVLHQAWLEADHPKDSIMVPTNSTLTAIIEAYAFNDRLSEGIQLMLAIQKKYGLDLSHAINTWTRCLRLAVENLQPSGKYPKELFEQIWGLALSHKVIPTMGMWTIRIDYLRGRGQFDTLANMVPELLQQLQGEKIAETALRHAVKGYTNTGRALEALELLEKWANNGLDIRVSLQEYVRRRTGVTTEQLRMYKDDDDDNDWF